MEAAYLTYLGDLDAQMHELMDRNLITGASLTFPLVDDSISFHFTLHGTLASSGDRYSTKLIATWDEVPRLYDIHTDQAIAPLEFLKVDAYRGIQEVMKASGTLELECASDHAAQILEQHYASEYAKVDVSVV